MKRIFNLFHKTNLALLLTACTAYSVSAQNPGATSEPVFRTSKNQVLSPGAAQPHSLDPAIQLAHQSLIHSRATIKDYTAIVVKREQIDGELGDYEYMYAKVRNRAEQNGQIVTPFSVYLTFVKPAAVKGREVLYVEGANEGKLVAHEGGLKRLAGTHHLEPTHWLAMKGQRYPITDLGIENLLVKLIERADRDRQHGECKVEFLQGAKVSGRECRVIQVTHPEKVGPFDFHIAQVFLDNELQVPVRYAAYDWPKTAGAEPVVIEEYTYQNIKVNVGLTDKDFDIANSDYNFHK
jgi:hypothetical protein